METKRNLNIEILRILGCLMVIGVHVKLPDLIDGSPVWIRLFFSCLFADGVSIFWLILGYFGFQAEISYGERLKRMSRRILLPLAVYTVFSFYLSRFLIDGKPLLESLSHSFADYRTMLTRCILRWQNRVDYGSHLWYLYIYVIVILLFPALSGIWKLWQDNLKKSYIAFFTLIALLIVNDYSYNELCDFSHHSFPGAIAASIFVLLGSIYSQWHNLQPALGSHKRNRRILLGMLLFAGTLAFRVPWLYFSYWLGKGDEPVYWYTSFSVLQTGGLFLIFTNLNLDAHLRKKPRRILLHLARMTFPIYIIHMMVAGFFFQRNLTDYLENVTGNLTIDTAIYQIGYMIAVFLVSMAISEVLILIKHLLKK